MNQKSLSVLFLLKKDKTNSQGTCPIYCRITYLKRRKQFSALLLTDYNMLYLSTKVDGKWCFAQRKTPTS